jgi:type IVB pilus formation R64 PilN family outer membrane protein
MKALRWSLLVLALSLSGCGGLPKKLDSEIDDARARALKLSSALSSLAPAAGRSAAVRHDDGAWFGKRAVRITSANDLPVVFDVPATFDGSVANLQVFADRISTRSGLPVRVMPDALLAISKSDQANGVAREAKPPMRIVYQSGTFKGLLDVVSARFGINWRYSSNEIQFHALETRSFNIHAVPGEALLSASVTNSSSSAGGNAGGGSAGGGQGGGNQGAGGNNKLNIDSQLSVWGNVEKAISSMLSSAGKLASSPATGTITITDLPDVLDRIAKYVDSENRSLTKQVVVNVTVLGVTLSDSDSYGINWNSVYQTAYSRFGVKNAFAAEAGTPSFSASVLDTASSKWAGSEILINALSTQGKVRRETALAVMALNNQPVPVLVAQQTTYLASSQVTLSTNVGASTSLTPGTVTTGVNMTILPHVLDNGTVMLQLSAGLSVLRGITTVSSGGSSIQTPQVDTRNFLQRVAMRSGETLVISGFEQTDGNVDHEGVGHSSNLLMGAQRAKSSKEIFVVIITPALLGSESL